MRKDILNKLCDINGNLSSMKLKYYKKYLTENEILYIKNKYSDVITDNDVIECIKCLKYNIVERHKCPMCGKYTKFKRINYNMFCSIKCARNSKETQNKQRKTCLKLYGFDNPSKSDIIKHKQKHIFISKYGVDNPFKSDYIKEKIKRTCIEHFGVDNYFKTKICIEKSHSKECLLKKLSTMRKNNTFNTSKQEDECYNILCSIYNKENIIRQYKSEVYPFQCDFYIKSINTYIECNFHWTHNNHLYNKNNIKDIIAKCRLKQNAKKSKYYNIALNVWTIRDVKKYNIAKKNKLNYIIFYDIMSFKAYYNINKKL